MTIARATHTAQADRRISSILEGNSFTAADLPRLRRADRDLIVRRQRILANSYRLFYRLPVHVRDAEGCYIVDAEGNRLLDAYNNVASIGHANAEVRQAVERQLSRINTHTRYLHDGIVHYTEQLLHTFPAPIDKAVFTNSGSESNDLAVRIARIATGGQGIVVTTEAYHGTTDLLARLSPALAGGFVPDPAVRLVQPPDTYRAAADDVAAAFERRIAAAFEDLAEHGVRPAGLLVDSIFSSDGIFPHPNGTLAVAARAARRAGALLICDEVQPGFGRTGDHLWGFARHGVTPDLVTLGKPMGNGVPVSAVLGRGEILDRFGRDVPYFNTFGGNPVAIAAAQAVLDFIQRHGIVGHVAAVGRHLAAGLGELAQHCPAIGDIRGVGLYHGVEVVADADRRRPDSNLALGIVNDLRERGVLISVCGPHNNVLKIRPPLVFGPAEADLLVGRLAEAFAATERARSRG
jgi:4-aminobutyrate aminotransferase-like enzyme